MARGVTLGLVIATDVVVRRDERVAQSVVDGAERRCDRSRIDSGRGQVAAVEAQRELAERGIAVGPHGLDDLSNGGYRAVTVDHGTRQDPAQVAGDTTEIEPV